MVTLTNEKYISSSDEVDLSKFSTRAVEQGVNHFETVNAILTVDGPTKTSNRKSLLICSECKYVTEGSARFEEHFSEPRHVNNYRNLAYKYPKKRQLWLKVWFDKLESAESKNAGYFEVVEEEEAEKGDHLQERIFEVRRTYSVSSSTMSDCSLSSF